MPGLSVLNGPYRDHGLDRTRLFDAVCYFDDYDHEIAVETPSTLVGTTGYDGYPLQRFETDRAVVVVEGCIYEEFSPAELVAAIDGGGDATLADWVATTDGDYLIAVSWTDSDAVTLLNDTFARLPAYYGTVGDTTVLSRELGFIREFARQADDPVTLDRLAAAQQLVFEYPLGTRTLFEGVRTLPPGSLVHVDDGVSVTRLHQYDFGRTIDGDRSRAETATELADRLVTACERRQESADTVVSLSGGLDSRVVLAGYAAAGGSFSTVTFDKDNGIYADDVEIAGAIADTLDLRWKTYRVSGSDGARSTLLDLKQGLNNVGMAYMVDFFEQLRADHGPVTYVTGDGGHRALVDETPPREPTSMADLVDQLLEANARFTPAEAAEITTVDEAAILDSVRERLAGYPEDSLTDKYDHFMFRERGLNFIQHGEDRNRYFCWSVSPFYDPAFFRYAIRCPTPQKRNHGLFTALLEELSPPLLGFEYANVGAPPGTLEFRIKEFLIDQVMRRKRVKDVIARLFKDDSATAERIAGRLRAQLSADEPVQSLDSGAVAAVADDPGSYRPYGLNTLLTVTMLASDLTERQAATVPTT